MFPVTNFPAGEAGANPPPVFHHSNGRMPPAVGPGRPIRLACRAWKLGIR